MKFSNIHVIINPTASQPQHLLERLNNAVVAWPASHTISVASEADSVFAIAAKFAHTPDLIAIYGGDGCISDVARALYGKRATMGIIPGGTANVTSKDLGIPQDIEGAIAVLVDDLSVVRYMDMGVANDTPFILRVNFGIMADMIIGADKHLKDSFGQLAYGFTAFESLWKSDPVAYRMVIDGEQIHEFGVALTVTNVGNIGIGDFSFLPDITTTDGLLDVILMNNTHFLSLMRLAGATLFQTDSDVLKHWRCREITIIPEKPMKYICDDVVKETEFLTITVAPSALKVLVPDPDLKG